MAWLGIAGVGLATFLLLVGRNAKPARSKVASAGFFVFVAGVFAVINIWQGPESAAAIVSRSLPEEGISAEVRGVVTSEPQEAKGGRRGFFTMQVGNFRSGEKWYPADFAVRVIWQGKLPEYGDSVEVRGVLENLPEPRNPGEFSFAEWLSRQGVYSQVRLIHEKDGVVLASGSGNPLMRMALSVRRWMREVITRDLDPSSPQAQLIVAMTLGETGPMPPVILNEFRTTGTYHLFSVSGLHVGMVGALLWLVLSTTGMPRKVMIGIIIPALFFYALITGWKPPSVRAAVMGAFVLAGLLTDRPVVVLNSLCAAAFFILIGNTSEVFSVGFQLSFLVVAALIILVPPLQRNLEHPLRCDEFLPSRLYHFRDRAQNYLARQLSGLVSVSVAAWLGSVVLIVGSFHLVSFSAVPANLINVPLAFCIMFTAMASLCVVFPWLIVLLNNANWLLASLMLWMVHGLAILPGSAMNIGRPEFSTPDATMVVFDCGAGGAISLTTASQRWLIDTGPSGFPERTLLPYLRERGGSGIDGLILTHGDARHIGGAQEMLDQISLGRVFFPVLADRSSTRRTFLSELKNRGMTSESLQTGNRLEVAPGVVCSVLYPPTDIDRSVADDKALVLLWEVGGWRVLMISDAGFFTEMWLLENARETLRADVLIKGNHARGIGLQSQFLDAVRPSVLITTVAEQPEAEKLPPSLEDLLRERGVRCFRQDETGAVTVRFFSDRLEVQGFLDESLYSQPRADLSSRHESR